MLALYSLLHGLYLFQTVVSLYHSVLMTMLLAIPPGKRAKFLRLVDQALLKVQQSQVGSVDSFLRQAG